MTSKRSSFNLSIAEHEKDRLEQIALELGQTWGDRPNVSKLIKSIAQGKLRVAANHDWSRERVDTLIHGLNLLIDAGHINEAKCLAGVLVERSEINQPLREMIQAFVSQPRKAWRPLIEHALKQFRPFRLTYQDAAGRIFNFTVHHAKIERHENREYLDCWCDETEGNQDVDALKHNWCLRFDHIPDEAVISPAGGLWQPELDYVDVEIHLLNRLAIAYESKSKSDRLNQWDPERQVRRVVRRITNTFWFFREVRRYGGDCIIVGPKEVRDRFAEDALRMAAHYVDAEHTR